MVIEEVKAMCRKFYEEGYAKGKTDMLRAVDNTMQTLDDDVIITKEALLDLLGEMYQMVEADNAKSSN